MAVWRPPGSAQPRGAARGYDAIAQYGRGERDPISGVYEWYEIPQGNPARGGQLVGWPEILTHWPLIEADLHSEYGIDTGAGALLRPWPWLRTRIVGLLSADTRLARALTPPDAR